MSRLLKISWFISLSVFLFTSCSKEEDKNRVTQYPVSFTVDLTKDNELESLYAYKVYTKKDIFLGNEYIDSPGIIVFNNGDPMEIGKPYVAYDVRCPYENKMDVQVSLDGIEAICSECKSKYDLTFGTPIEGPSRKRLQDYCINNSSSGLKRLLIRNCN